MAARARADYVQDLANQLGGDLLSVVDGRGGWPSLCKIRVGEKWENVALHVGRIGLSKRGRDDVERRFQNPLLIGVLYGDGGKINAIAGMDAVPRLGKSTRFSLFLPLEGLQKVPLAGWVEHVSSRGERIHLFRPELLPVFAGIEDPSAPMPELEEIVEASGLGGGPEEAEERARRAALRAVRRSGFGRRVVDAYGGVCAMCGLDEGLVEGAHIYPVQAPGSVDELWNGIALCANHHRAFDLHRVFVAPADLRVHFHPDLVRAAETGGAACKALIATARVKLALPAAKSAAPKPDMFAKRYEYFAESYSWAA